MRFALLAALAVGSAGSAGCATIFIGPRDEIHFTSEPGGATVVAGELTGKTPCTLNVSKTVASVTFEAEGHPARQVPIPYRFQAGYVVLDILFTPGYGALGILIDALTQSWWKPPKAMHVDFTKPPPEPPPPPPKLAEQTDPWDRRGRR